MRERGVRDYPEGDTVSLKALAYEATTRVTLQPLTQEVCAPMPNQYTTPIPALVRFWTKVNFGAPEPEHRPELGACWLWNGVNSTDRYGSFSSNQRLVPAHRYAYEFCVGPIATWLEVDHLCLIKACVNPDHLEPVTHRENSLRNAALITHCPHGHFYDEANTRWGVRGRQCRRCDSFRTRQKRRRPS